MDFIASSLLFIKVPETFGIVFIYFLVIEYDSINISNIESRVYILSEFGLTIIFHFSQHIIDSTPSFLELSLLFITDLDYETLFQSLLL